MADEKDKNEKILSQNEVDSLLNAVRSGEVSVESGVGGAGSVQKYDFSQQRKLVRARMPGLKIIFDRFQRTYRQTLSSLVRKVVLVEYLQTEMQRYGEWVSNLAVPSCLSILRLSPLIGQSIVSLEPAFVYTLIDNIFGGGRLGQFKKKEGDFTSIELKMIQRLVQYCTADLEKAWSTIHELNFEFVRTDTNPEYVSIVAPSDVVVVTDVSITFEDVTSKMQIVIPLFALDPVKQLLSDHTYVEQTQPNPNWKIWMGDSIRSSKAELGVRLGNTEVTMRDVLGLSVGDTVQLNQYVAEPLHMSLEGVSKFAVKLGTHCGQQAVQILSVAENPTPK
ncbi:MAG: Flagellar motor switch protein FliM [Bacteriovoracaceae bacterium]|nr:Flagellar motor switch protein FliM [Bacteriovoracaceae bacterium]